MANRQDARRNQTFYGRLLSVHAVAQMEFAEKDVSSFGISLYEAVSMVESNSIMLFVMPCVI